MTMLVPKLRKLSLKEVEETISLVWACEEDEVALAPVWSPEKVDKALKLDEYEETLTPMSTPEEVDEKLELEEYE